MDQTEIHSLNKKNKKIKVGIIGFGRMGMMHGALFNSLNDSTLIAVMDKSDFPAKQLSVLNSAVKYYRTIVEMFKESKPDAVLIASPVASHVDIAMTCVEHGVPFLLEKPLSRTAQEAEPLLQRLKEKPIINMVGYVYRYLDSFVKGKEIIDSNCLGKIHRVTSNMYISQFFEKGKGWRFDPKMSGGGSLINNGTHVIDILTWYFGPVKTVNSNVLSVYTPGIDDFAHLTLKHQSGVNAMLDCSWSVRFKRKIDIKIDILGENGSLVISDDTVQLYLDKKTDKWPAGKTEFNANDLYTPVPVDIGTPKFTFQNQHFLNCIRKDVSASPDVFQAYHVQQIVDAGYLSSKKDGMPIHINL